MTVIIGRVYSFDASGSENIGKFRRSFKGELFILPRFGIGKGAFEISNRQIVCGKDTFTFAKK